MKRVSCSNVSHIFSRKIKPAIVAKPGENIVFETLDARGGRSVPGQRYSPPPHRPREELNPVTGPVFIEEAEPGDVLAVEIKSIEPGKWGFVSAHTTVGVLKDWTKDAVDRAVRVDKGTVYFSKDLTFLTRPMIGTIGVAPGEGEVRTIDPGIHGGNMDCNDVVVGSTVYLPVFIKGALLAMGDIHAFMGDGEISGGGLDISADVEAKINLLKGVDIHRPLIETEQHFVFTYNAGDLKTAVRGVVGEAVKHLSSKLNLSLEDAIMLVSTVGDVMICQACDGPIDVVTRLRIPKEVFPGNGHIFSKNQP